MKKRVYQRLIKMTIHSTQYALRSTQYVQRTPCNGDLDIYDFLLSTYYCSCSALIGVHLRLIDMHRLTEIF